MKIGRWILYVLGSHMDANDAHHGNTTDVFDRCQPSFFQAENTPYLLRIKSIFTVASRERMPASMGVVSAVALAFAIIAME